jgi:CopG family transcriptional regulator, nickel-responsive regulator
MSGLTRFGVSLDSKLLKEFDKLILKKRYNNRSEAIRDLIRDKLVQKEWEGESGEQVGTITIIYDHHSFELSNRITNEQHKHYSEIISTMHVHLDHDNCLEVLAVKGKAKDIQRIADELISMKGIKHGKLVTTTTGQNLT